mmetsp:Transcript_26387/g.26638  ORF Transcript_26387/g.26638 Transcript_26387/m.26638 type:complete len:408 (+) Transcript_26387:97-1320(+)|eukprot:CAMPEP_0182428548 /NCGR_PEP_ID=MMETSP1167-20130531/23101_1 /TAXON_ID=2988 /ORGANISM="Mallomonas Sp, Strain CCMP3275" /LENGTH=407 /DNA_ID=CAMNT_0024611507 /DNA_START=83 /DNA_END=1306 /DNA_ORIENTATION=-
MNSKTILVGDIGGTNSRLFLFKVNLNEISAHGLKTGQVAPGTLLYKEEYENKGYSRFEDIVLKFLDTAKEVAAAEIPVAACLAAAGPVSKNSVSFTNRGWTISGSKLKKVFGINTVKIVNDFVGAGYGLLTLNHAEDCYTLQSAPPQTDAPIACIGAGTGLGQCFLTPNDVDGSYKCFSSEGGHAEYAPRTPIETEMLAYLKQKFNHAHRVSVERIVSGTGLANIYEFLSIKYKGDIDPVVHKQILDNPETAGKIIANNPQCKLCQQTMEIFVTAYGSEAGVAALKWMPKGGLYLAGGLTPKNLELLKGRDGPFMRALRDKGRVSGFLADIPIYAVLKEDLGVRGAHWVAVQDMIKLAETFESHKPLTNLTLRSTENAVRGSYSFVGWGVAAVLATVVVGLLLDRKK